LNEVLKENESILFAIPKSVFYLPSQIQKFCTSLMNFSETEDCSAEEVLYNVPKNEIGNQLNIFNSKEEFFSQFLFFYLTVFATDKIRNPELRESFNTIVYSLVNSELSIYILSSSVLIESFIKGVLIDIDKYFLSQMATSNILKLVDRFSLTDIKSHENINSINLNMFKNFSVNKSQLFESLCGKVFTNLNKYMSDFMQDITNTYNILHTNNNSNILINSISKKDSIKKFISNSIIFSEYLVLLEILIKVNSSMFLDQRSLLFTNLLNFLTNISTRLTNADSHKKIKEILSYNVDDGNPNQNKVNIRKALMNDVFRSLGYPIISIFNDLNSVNAFSEENEFSKQLSLSDFIDFQNFQNIVDDLKNEIGSKQISSNNSDQTGKNSSNVGSKSEFDIEEDIRKYKETISLLIEKKKIKTKLKINEDELNDKNDNEKLCFICFTRNMDTVLSPCKHGIFLNIYLIKVLFTNLHNYYNTILYLYLFRML